MARTDRFKGAPWFETVKSKPIIVGGAGGLGSWLALWLSRMGCDKVGIFDPDTVEEHNLSGQCFSGKHIGMLKVEAVREVCADMGVSLPYIFPTRFEDSPKKAPYMFSCFDNMEARKMFFEAWKAVPGKKLFLDARIEAEHAFIYTVTPEKIEEYELTLKDDSEIVEAGCTYKQTSPIAAYATSRMWQAFVNYCTPFPRVLVFKESYRGPSCDIILEGKYTSNETV